MIQVLEKTKKMVVSLIANGGKIDNDSLLDLRSDIVALLSKESNANNKKALTVVDNELQSLLGLRPFSGHKETQNPDIIINEIYGILVSLSNNNVPIYDPYTSSWRDVPIKRPPSVRNG